MTEPIQQTWYARSLTPERLLLLSLLLVAAGLYAAGDVLLPALLALVGAYLLERPVQWLQAAGFKRSHAVCIVMLAVGALLWWLLATLLPLVWVQGQAFLSALPDLAATGRLYLEQLWSAQNNWFSERQLTLVLQRLESQSLIFLNTLLASSLDGVAGVFYALVYLVLLPMMVFFLLKDKDSLVHGIQRWLPGTGHLLRPAWQELDHQLLGYIQGKLLELVLLATWLHSGQVAGAGAAGAGLFLVIQCFCAALCVTTGNSGRAVGVYSISGYSSGDSTSRVSQYRFMGLEQHHWLVAADLSDVTGAGCISAGADVVRPRRRHESVLYHVSGAGVWRAFWFLGRCVCYSTGVAVKGSFSYLWTCARIAGK